MKAYAGIGSRKTPTDVLTIMVGIGKYMADKGYLLRSGGAIGADKAFELGCDKVGGRKEIFTPETFVREPMHIQDIAREIAAKYHPNWKNMSGWAKRLHARNAQQILGKELKDPVHCVICWTPDGCKNHMQRSIKTGGTGTAISIASMMVDRDIKYQKKSIPVINLKDSTTWNNVVRRLSSQKYI